MTEEKRPVFTIALDRVQNVRADGDTYKHKDTLGFPPPELSCLLILFIGLSKID
jgi:hypothetical protein